MSDAVSCNDCGFGIGRLEWGSMTARKRSRWGRLVELVDGHKRDAPPEKVPPRQVTSQTVVENATVAADMVYGGGSYVLADPLEEVTLIRSRFEMWQHPQQRSLQERPTVRRLHVERCHVTASDLGPLVIEDSTLDTVWIHRGKWGPQSIGGSVFKHVTVRGRITGSVSVLPYPHAYAFDPKDRTVRERFMEANARYYRSVDWALDISQAEFTSFDNEWADVPARLYRRDPETQVIVTRESCLGRDWRAAAEDSYLWVHLERFLESGFADTVIVAPKRSKHFDAVMAAIGRLRDIGVVLPG
ncbi:MAG TPA: hypothetical protein VHR55_05935 [Candidatus Limnocylindria bacterium]|nr:hypothetical protein [Candidatus Limnocylindria bacterium]